MASKVGILTIVGLIAVLLALIGSNFTVIAGLSLTWIVMGWILLELTGITASIPVLKQLSGKSNPTTITYIFVALLLINLGVIGAVFSGGGAKAPSGGITLPTAAVTGTTTTATTISAGTGQSYIGQFDFRPVDGNGNTFATATTSVALVDGTPTRYDFMKQLSNIGTSAVMFQGVSSRFYTVSSGSFQETQLQGKVGDHFSVCGYKDTTPAAAENISFCKSLTLTGFNPQSGSNGGIWSWQFDDGSGIRYKEPSYATTYWYDGGEVNRGTYTDSQTTALTGRSVTAYVFPNNTGESITNAGLYIESNSGNASNIKQVTIQNVQTGKSVTYTSLSNTALMSTASSEYLSAPSLVTSGNTVYSVGKFPDDGYIRTSSSDKGKYAVTVLYDNPSTGNWIWYLRGVQNFNALTSSGGHFNFDQPNGFLVNATQFTGNGTNGFS